MSSKNALATVEHVGRAAAPGVLTALLSLTTDAVLVIDGAERIISANSQAEILTGYKAAELAGK